MKFGIERQDLVIIFALHSSAQIARVKTYVAATWSLEMLKMKPLRQLVPGSSWMPSGPDLLPQLLAMFGNYVSSLTMPNDWILLTLYHAWDLFRNIIILECSKQ
jgi:hypothetical protein